jgi:hypothetical protein
MYTTMVLWSWPLFAQRIEYPADLAIAERQRGGVDLHVAGIDPPLIGGEAVPGSNAGRRRGYSGVRGNDAEPFLPRERLTP